MKSSLRSFDAVEEVEELSLRRLPQQEQIITQRRKL